jgi:hypothetical protein
VTSPMSSTSIYSKNPHIHTYNLTKEKIWTRLKRILLLHHSSPAILTES